MQLTQVIRSLEQSGSNLQREYFKWITIIFRHRTDAIVIVFRSQRENKIKTNKMYASHTRLNFIRGHELCLSLCRICLPLCSCRFKNSRIKIRASWSVNMQSDGWCRQTVFLKQGNKMSAKKSSNEMKSLINYSETIKVDV